MPTKPLNYSKLTGVTQEKKENPTAFLEKFREALRKHTYLDPDSPEGQLILKDKFTTQSAPDIWRKLQKLVFCPNMDLQCLLRAAAAAVAVAKSLQSCPTLCDPIDGSPSGSPVPGILQARTLEWVAISFSDAWKWKVKVKSLSRVRLLVTPWTAAYQAPPSIGFSR